MPTQKITREPHIKTKNTHKNPIKNKKQYKKQKTKTFFMYMSITELLLLLLFISSLFYIHHIKMDNKIERLDLKNVIEIQQIKTILKDKKLLLDFFNDLLNSVNKNLNNEPPFSPCAEEETDEEEFEMVLESDEEDE
tara:strand:- start:3498 stop:3908 length:411 start_codon:yes stop_codon:yes gene_type:complete